MSGRIPLRQLIRDPKCRLCPLWEGAQSVCLIGDGRYPADLFLVGEAPGYREDEIHKPFAGRAGEMLDSILDTLKIPRWGKGTRIFISNAVHCRPPENAKPTKGEIHTCASKFLRRELKHVRPKLVIAMGAVAGEGILQQTISVGRSRNKIWLTKEPFLPDVPVIVTYHPAAVLRQEGLLRYLVEDFEWALRIIRGEEAEEEEVDYKLIKSLDEAPSLRKAKKLSVDLETDGFDPFLKSREIISIQLTDKPRKGYYLRWDDKVRDEVKPLLEDPNIIKIGHNVGRFDRKWMRKAGLDMKGPIRDTLIQTSLVDENLKPKDLDVVASAFTPLKQHKDEMQEYLKKNKCSFRDVPLHIAVPYGCGDVDAALRLEEIFTPKIKKQGSWPLFNLLTRVSRLYTDLEWNGFKIDVPLIDEIAVLYERKLRSIEIKLEGINPRSHVQVGDKLYRQWGFPALGFKKGSKKKVRNTAEDTLLKLMELDIDKEQRTFIKRILRARETSTLLSRYVLGLSDFIREGDLVHPNYKLHGPVTGRSSCADPNLQNIPREGDIKRLFVSRFGKRGRILQVDISQAELRFAAHLAHEPTLLAYFRRGDVDIHRAVAARVYKKEEKDVTERERKKTKIVNFGILYGAGAGKMAAQMNCSFQEAQEFIEEWMGEFPYWREYAEKVRREVLENGFVQSPFGRIRHLPILDPHSESGKEAIRQAVNSPIQGGVSDFNKHCGFQIWKRLKKEKIKPVLFVAEVHDNWVVDTVEGVVEDVVAIFKDEYENADLSEYGFQLDVPMKIEASVGLNWKELEDVS